MMLNIVMLDSVDGRSSSCSSEEWNKVWSHFRLCGRGLWRIVKEQGKGRMNIGGGRKRRCINEAGSYFNLLCQQAE